MAVHPHVAYWYRLLHRYNPFRAEVGLSAIGNPGPDAPILVSGNYEHTVEQLRAAITDSGVACWLLIADSAGINVWCAAGVGDFNEIKIVDAIVATRLAEKVTRRQLILSPLAAVGIDRDRLRRDTGFTVTWGPAHLDDLPAYLRAGCKREPAMRLAKFTRFDRAEQVIGMLGVFSFPLVFAYWWPRHVGWFMGSLLHAIAGSMLGYFRLPPKYPANKTMLLGVLQALMVVFFWPRRSAGAFATSPSIAARLILGLIAHVLIAIDMIGSTPFFKTTIIDWLRTGRNDSLFQPDLTAACTSCGQCIEVCPKGLFSRNAAKQVVVDRTQGCCECLACVKQCPHGAISNVGTGWKDDIRSLTPEAVRALRQPQSR